MPLSVELVCVDPEQVFKFWQYVKPFIFSAGERTGLSNPEETEFEILRGDQLLWIVWNGKSIEAAGSTRLSNGICTITALGGKNMKRWVHLFPRIEQYAENEGCRLRISGRRGWERVLKPLGYRAKYVILERSA
jgi:hypothetical protein